MDQNQPPSHLITMHDLMARTGVRSRSTIYRMVDKGRCPKPVDIGGGRVRWRAGDIETWLRGLPPKPIK